MKMSPDIMRSQQNLTPSMASTNSSSKLITEPMEGLVLGTRNSPSISKKNFKSIQDFRAIVGFNSKDSSDGSVGGGVKKKGLAALKFE